MKPKLRFIIFALTTLLVVQEAMANTERLNYQGKLAHGNSPVTATVPMTFQIYDGQSGTNVLYEESMDVDVVDGYYSVELGEYPNYGQLVSAIKREDAHIQVTVDGNALKPREKVGKPPFAEQSREVWREFFYTESLLPEMWEQVASYTNVWAQWASDYTSSLSHLTLSEYQTQKIFFTPPTTQKHIVNVKFMARKLSSDNYGYEITNKGTVQVVVRSILDDQVVRTLSNVISIETMSPCTWFECPLSNTYEESIVNPNEYLCLDFNGTEDGTGDVRTVVVQHSVFITIIAQ